MEIRDDVGFAVGTTTLPIVVVRAFVGETLLRKLSWTGRQVRHQSTGLGRV